MSTSFQKFAEDVLVEGGRQQRAGRNGHAELDDAIATLGGDHFDQWNEQIIPFLESQGWADNHSVMSDRRFRVTGAGFQRIDEITESRRPRTLSDFIQGINRSDWISIGALVVAALALLKD